ncbi:helix-turn-helix domain-containing protein [Corynebacterium phocae]|nr:helix-turn-helix domain-containing protein [Corynebacterium phocae]
MKQKKEKRVLELRSKGMSIRAIAEQTGYSVGTVHRYAKALSGTGV